MIEKIVSIKNVGRFEDFRTTGDTTLGSLTVIYSDNARGKTTLVSILRSLGTSEPALIFGRKTLGATGEPSVKIKLSNGVACFTSTGWNLSCLNIAVFDTRFVEENVCSGLVVSHDHKRHLFEFVVGRQGVTTAKRIAEIDAETRKLSSQILDKSKEIIRLLNTDLKVDKLISIVSDPDIEKSLAVATKLVTDLEGSGAIEKNAALEELSVPEFGIGGISSVLSKTLEDVSKDAEERTRAHIAEHLDDKGEAWLEQGAEYLEDDKCPFCGLSTTQVELVTSYRSFFSEGYRDLKKRIASSTEAMNDLLGSIRIADMQTKLLSNQIMSSFWANYISLSLPDPDLDSLTKTTARLRKLVAALLQTKQASPLESLEIPPNVDRALSEYELSRASLRNYNSAVRELNDHINRKKKSTEEGDLPGAKSDLAKLELVKCRHAPPVVDLCDEYQTLCGQKSTLTEEKTTLKEKLDSFTSKLLELYQKSINECLVRFGADFKVVGTSRDYIGGKPNTSYALSINQQEVKLGDQDTPDDQPCFKNTLSDGDRRTLAFSFFLAKLQKDPNLSRTCVVLDDPVCSADQHRRSHAVNEIRQLADTACQVLVLSHDEAFCSKLWNAGQPSARKALSLVRRGPRNSSIHEWNPEKDAKKGFMLSLSRLREYVEKGPGESLTDTALRIRLLLEGVIRSRFQGRFNDNSNLADMINSIKETDDSDHLSRLKTHLPELEDLNRFSRGFHHADEPSSRNVESVTDQELESYVKRAIRLAERIDL